MQRGPRGDRELRFYELVKAAADECTPDLAAELARLDPFGPRPAREARRRSVEGTSSPSLSRSICSRGRGLNAGLLGLAKLLDCKVSSWDVPRGMLVCGVSQYMWGGGGGGGFVQVRRQLPAHDHLYRVSIFAS